MSLSIKNFARKILNNSDNQLFTSGDSLVKEFPLFPLEAIAREAGKEVGADRVAASAAEEMRTLLLEMADKIASDAIAAARHAGRVTVKREDITLVTRS